MTSPYFNGKLYFANELTPNIPKIVPESPTTEMPLTPAPTAIQDIVEVIEKLSDVTLQLLSDFSIEPVGPIVEQHMVSPNLWDQDLFITSGLHMISNSLFKFDHIPILPVIHT